MYIHMFHAKKMTYRIGARIFLDMMIIWHVLLYIQGELFEILEDDKCLPEEQVQAIAKQLVFGSDWDLSFSLGLGC